LSVDLHPESFHDRVPESNISREGPPEFFGACVERRLDTGAKVAWFKDPDGNLLSVTELLQA